MKMNINEILQQLTNSEIKAKRLMEYYQIESAFESYLNSAIDIDTDKFKIKAYLVFSEWYANEEFCVVFLFKDDIFLGYYEYNDYDYQYEFNWATKETYILTMTHITECTSNRYLKFIDDNTTTYSNL